MVKKRQKPSFVAEMLSSFVTTAATNTLTFPLRRIRLTWQCQNELILAGRMETPFRSIKNCTYRIYSEGGMRSFWRGNGVAIGMILPSKMLTFMIKDALKPLKGSKNDVTSVKMARNMGIGGLSGILSLIFLRPFDFAQFRLTSDALIKENHAFTNLRDVFRKTWKIDGLRGFYRGSFIAIAGIFVYRGLYFGMYDSFKRVLLGDNPSFLGRFVFGYFVTLGASFLAYPCDTIQHRMMMRSCEKEKYSSGINCAKYIARNEGIRSLWRGASINIFSSVCGAATLAMFDEIKKWRMTSK